VKVGDLVKLKVDEDISSMGMGAGIVTEHLGVHCMVMWSMDPIRDCPRLEMNRELEVISESR
jgi:hypothetical protein